MMKGSHSMKQTFSVFRSELKCSASRFSLFAKQHKGVIGVLCLVLLFLYGVRIFYYDFSIDSEAALSSQQELLNSWLTINRFGLVFTKKIFFMNIFVPYVSNFLMILSLGFSAFFFDFCVQEWIGNDRRFRLFFYLFPVACVSAPCLAEQFFFSLQSFEIAWAWMLCTYSVYCFSRWLFFRESFLWIVPSLICIVWALGSYQAFAGLFISMALVSFLLYYQNPSASLNGRYPWLLCCIKYIVFFCISLLLYVLAGKAIRLYYGIPATDYVNSMFLWKTIGVREGLNNIKTELLRIYRGNWSVFFHCMFTPSMLICSLLFLVRGYRKQTKGFPLYVAAVLLLGLSPVFLSLVSGSTQVLRSQLSYVFVFAFFLAGITTFSRKSLAIFFCLAGVIVSLRQGQSLTQLFHTAFVVYNQDKALASSVWERLSQTAADQSLENFPVVFVGSRSAELTDGAQRGEMIGISFFEWDAASYCGSTGRIIGFCDTLGYQMEMPTPEQAALAQEYAASMPAWPATGSVQVSDGVMIVKLS